MERIKQYFPDLTRDQVLKFSALEALYLYWNARINVISRKDTGALMTRHVLHSLAIAGVVSFGEGARIMDAGTGGGFPGIPLAIMFPDAEFVLVDSTGKKIRVVREIVSSLKLMNVTTFHERTEKMPGEYDFIVSRAVAALPRFVPWVRDKIRPGSQHGLHNGILYLKGGNLDEELSSLSCEARVFSISDFFRETYFETKKIVHLYAC